MGAVQGGTAKGGSREAAAWQGERRGGNAAGGRAVGGAQRERHIWQFAGGQGILPDQQGSSSTWRAAQRAVCRGARNFACPTQGAAAQRTQNSRQYIQHIDDSDVPPACLQTYLCTALLAAGRQPLATWC